MTSKASSARAPALAAATCVILATSPAAPTKAFSPATSPRASMAMQLRSVHGSKPTTSMMTLRPSHSHITDFETAGEKSPSVTVAMSDEDMTDMIPTRSEKERESTNSTPSLASVSVSEKTSITTETSVNKENQFSFTQMSMQLATAVTACVLALMPLQDANAAMSGGRMGGSFTAAPSISQQAPSLRSSPSSPYARGYSESYRSRPAVTIAPGIGYGSYSYGGPFGSPFGGPLYSPFAGPRAYGGPGVLAVSRGPSPLNALFFGGLLYAVTQTALVLAEGGAAADTLGGAAVAAGTLGPGTSVVRLSVALEVPDRDERRSILGALGRLSDTARTDCRVGIQNLSSQVALEILRRRSSVVAASTSTRHFSDREKALREFQDVSVRERSKFESETVSKYGGVDYASSVPNILARADANGDRATMAVVTIILAINGNSTKLNKIRGAADVEQALQTIAADSKVGDCLQSAEILWTPEDRSETLGLRDVIADYPELRRI